MIDVLKVWRNERLMTREVLEKALPELAGYRPVPEVMSFVELALHVISAEKTLIAAYHTGEWVWEQGLTSERYPTVASVLELIEEHNQEAEQFFSQADLGRVLRAPWGEENSLTGFVVNWLMHESHHRGQMFTYLRLNSIQPPPYH